MREFHYSSDKEKIIEFLSPAYELYTEVDEVVSFIITNVKENGDAEVEKYTQKYDKVDLKKIGMRVTEKEIIDAYNKTDKLLIKALSVAARRIERFHKRQLKHGWSIKEKIGIELSQRYIPLERVGLYVPGGKAAYPSSVLMNAIPAKVAGVKEVVMVTPCSNNGEMNTTVLAAAYICGIKEIYRIGGAQAIAALAFGTNTIRRVDKIVGPGNKYVAAAKKLLYGIIDIDMIAGPSEILIVADASTPIPYIAADLLSQAEHDEDASAIVIHIGKTNSDILKREIERQTEQAPRAEIIRTSLEENGAIIYVDTIEQAIELANLKSSEHLELMFEGAENYTEKINNAGAIFVGKYTPEPIGDYIAGPNHVLPTGGTARFFSPLSVDDFVKKTNVIRFSKAAIQKLGKDTIRIAEEEGLFAHSQTIKVRL